jgi:hypothetical protein
LGLSILRFFVAIQGSFRLQEQRASEIRRWRYKDLAQPNRFVVPRKPQASLLVARIDMALSVFDGRHTRAALAGSQVNNRAECIFFCGMSRCKTGPDVNGNLDPRLRQTRGVSHVAVLTRLEWQKVHELNEALDCRVYARAAAWIAALDRSHVARPGEADRPRGGGR